MCVRVHKVRMVLDNAASCTCIREEMGLHESTLYCKCTCVAHRALGSLNILLRRGCYARVYLHTLIHGMYVHLFRFVTRSSVVLRSLYANLEGQSLL